MKGRWDYLAPCLVASWKSPVVEVPTQGKLFLWMIIITVKNFFLIQRWNLSWCNFYWNTVMMCPPSLLFSREKRPDSFSLSLLCRFSSPLITFMVLFWTLSSLSASFWNCGDKNLAQHSRCSQTSTKRRGMITSLSLPVTALQMQPGIRCALAAAAAHCWLLFSLCPPAAPGVSQQGCSPATLH